MAVELTSEDSLRLNVLAANADAIRINKNSMEVFGLHGDQEMRLQLHPTGNSHQYLKSVRELLASRALNSPEGYPAYIDQWARMGQIKMDRLDALLTLGNPDAVMAVVSSPGLTDHLAKLAWWCEPHAEYARQMLLHPEVVSGQIGPELALFLVEHLPFETEPKTILETVQLVLQPGLIDDETKSRLWNKGRTNKSYRVGFLLATQAAIPEKSAHQYQFAEHKASLNALTKSNNTYANRLTKSLGSEGQAFSKAVIDVMARPADQDAVSAIFNSIGNYFSITQAQEHQFQTIEDIELAIDPTMTRQDPALNCLLKTTPNLQSEIQAMLFLAHVSEALLIPTFSVSDAVGSVMRKKIQPVSTPIIEALNCLIGQTSRV